MKHFKSIYAVTLLATFFPNICFAHQGSILSTPSKVNSEISADGIEIVTIENNIIPADEIRVMTFLKKFLGKKYGEKALQWPIMLQLKAGEAQVFNEELGKYFKVRLSELPKE